MSHTCLSRHTGKWQSAKPTIRRPSHDESCAFCAVSCGLRCGFISMKMRYNLSYTYYILIYIYCNTTKHEIAQIAQGDTLGFCAKNHVRFVRFHFSTPFLGLFLFNRLLFLVIRRILVNENAQISLCPLMRTSMSGGKPPHVRKA